MRLAAVTFLSALALAVGLSASGGAAAPQSKAGSGCAKGRVCVWSEKHFQGQKLKLRARPLTNRIGGKMNDDVESVKVRKRGVAILYENLNGDGEARCFPGPHGNFENLGSNEWRFENTVSSSRTPKLPRPECVM